MPLTINVSDIKRYIDGVHKRAQHHAQSVDVAAVVALGACILYSSGDMQVRTTSGGLGNVVWVTINNTPVFVGYNHDTGQIEVRQETQQGAVLFSFDDATPAKDIIAFFAGLP